MSFLDKLPGLYAECKNQARVANWNLNSIQDELEAEDHSCDCDYCDRQTERLRGKAREEKEKEFVKANRVVVDLEATLRSMQGYAKMFDLDLEKEK